VSPDAVFLIVGGVLLVVLPTRLAVLPVLLAAAYTTRIPVLELGPATFTVLRTLVVVGFVRILARGEWIAHGLNAVDRLLIAWAILLIGTSLFHTADAWVYRMGLVMGELGVYLLCRVFVRDAEDVKRLFMVLCVALLPLAVLLLLEKSTAHNYFGLAGADGGVVIRDGRVRAFGPFGHPILAGTVGATCVPIALSLWRAHRVCALIGLCTGVGIVVASTSSGPIMMVLFTCVGLLMWKARGRLRLIRWATVAAVIALQIVMNDPVYFLMARIDITGGSTGWFRAQLIRSSIEHLSEWWIFGTDYTRHWMASGIYANQNHTDMTNHFLAMGVRGGLPLMSLFMLMLWTAFRAVGAALGNEGRSPERGFLIWTLGAMLFGYTVNFWSITLFDQSVSFFYLVLAAIGAIQLPALVMAERRLDDTARTRAERQIASDGVRKGGQAALGWDTRRRVHARPLLGQRSQLARKESETG
jgi:hypothetical protein